MAAYFENFPLIRYGNVYARNIAVRSALTSETLKNAFVYYPYEIKSEMRADLLSHYYYNDPLASWVFYISNNIIDPFYQWYKSNDQVSKLIESKYGSLANATQQIKFWRVNWASDDSIINTTQYNELIVNFTTNVNQQKYWTPIFSDNNIIVGYRRKKLDTTVETNKFVSFNVSYSSGNSFSLSERVIQTSESIVTATGVVSFSTADNLILKNITGTFSNNVSLVGETSNTTATYTTATVLKNNIPDQESQYWSSVSFYDYEIETNESLKSINVIDNKYLANIEDNLRKVFK